MEPTPHPRVRPIPSSYGVGGETGYTAQEDLKSINSYNRRGKDNKNLFFFFFSSCIPRPALVFNFFFFCSFLLGTPHRGRKWERVSIMGGEFAAVLFGLVWAKNLVRRVIPCPSFHSTVFPLCWRTIPWMRIPFSYFISPLVTGKNKIWLYVLSVSLTFAFCCFCYYNH